MNLLNWITTSVKYFAELVPKGARAVVVVLVVLNIISGFYVYSVNKQRNKKEEELIKCEKEKTAIVNDLKNDFLHYLQEMILIQKNTNNEIDSLTEK